MSTITLVVTTECGDHEVRSELPVREYSTGGVWVRCGTCGEIRHAAAEASE